MKVIDLLNKIANREEIPKIIKYDETIYLFRNYDYKEFYIESDYCDENSSFIEQMDFYKLNNEVEIIEEPKKIEKLKLDEDGSLVIDDRTTLNINVGIKIAINKINEIIDKLNEMGSE